MRRALCLFHPQTRFADSFGLVVAEANALGAPALVPRGLGANAEMVSSAERLVDGDDPAAIEARPRDWRARPPAVAANPRFRLTAAARDWRRVLADMERPFDAAEAAFRARPAFPGVGPAQVETPIRSGA